MVLPAAVGFVVFYLVPTVRGIWLSFTNSTLLRSGSFVGARNYERMLSDDLFWNAVKVTLEYVVINIGVQTVVALAVAVALDRLTQSVVIRALVLIPWLVPGVTVGLLWSWILDPSLGILNQLLTSVGLPSHSYLTDPSWAMPSIALINTWRYIGYVTLLFFAGLQMIPRHLYEAAAIDGASEPRMFRSITLPLLRPVLVLVILVTTTGSLQVFDLIAVTTKGGPINATRSLYVYIYQQGFEVFNISFASAMAVTFMIVTAVLTLIGLRVGRAGESDLGAA